MTNSTPSLPMLARQNHEGTSVNESSVCASCQHNEAALEASQLNWGQADDVNVESDDAGLYPIDNPDGVCNGCGAYALFPLEN